MNAPRMGRGIAIGLLVASLAAPAARAEVRYEIKDLGTLGGATSGAEGINELGQIVGLSQITGSSSYHAFVADPAGLRDLGTLGGAQSGARAINRGGDIVGWATAANDEKHAFYYHDGQMLDLGSLAGSPVDAFSLNDAGEVVGSYISGFYERAFVWSGGTMQDIGTLGGTDSRAIAVNNHGDVVGFARPIDDMQIHACLWRGGVATDLGTLGGWASHAIDINENGKIVGWSMEDPNYISHAFEWADGVMIDLGTIGGPYSSAFAINRSGQVVGVSSDARNVQHAVMWEGGQIEDLNGLIAPEAGWFLSMATDNNDVGQIVGYGLYQGNTHAFLLTPMPALSAGPPVTGLAFAGAAPNPGFGATALRFSLPSTAQVTLRVFDVRGRAVRTLAEREFGPGENRVLWDGRNDDGSLESPGVYWARLEVTGHSFTRRLTLLR